MKDGFARVAAGTPAVRAGDTQGNARAIIALIREAEAAGAKALALPELCVTGCTAGDLLLQETLLRGALAAVGEIAAATRDAVVCFGAPLPHAGRLYDCAVLAQRGRVLGVVPKKCLSDFGASDETRRFMAAPAENDVIRLPGGDVPFGPRLLFACEEMPQLVFAAEVGAVRFVTPVR